jgi:hypothetical protein
LDDAPEVDEEATRGSRDFSLMKKANDLASPSDVESGGPGSLLESRLVEYHIYLLVFPSLRLIKERPHG